MKRNQSKGFTQRRLLRTAYCGISLILGVLPAWGAAGGFEKAEPASGLVSQQEGKTQISGVVVDEQGNPLPGVTVLIKGTTQGAATDIDGKFALLLPHPKEVLVVSFVGMKTREVEAVAGKPLKIVLHSDAKMIDEVIVTGYQKIDRKLFTGSASRVEMDDIRLGGESDVAKALEGQVAGVTVQNVSSTFGTAPKIRVRGSSSIYGDQKPLWVVDGVVLEDAVDVSVDQLNSGDLSTLVSSGVAGLNTDDIESMQILKDVSATALYGARAMNGVIVVTTKRGRTGRIDVNYSTNIAIKPIPSYSDYNVLNSREQMSINRELYEKGWINVAETQKASNHGPYGKMFDEIAAGRLNWADNDDEINAFLRKYETANTDWFDILFKPGVQQQHTVSISGGNEKTTFYTSVGYLHDGGWTVADKVKRYTALLKGTFNLTKRLSITAQGNLSYRDQKLSGVSNSAAGVGGVDRYTGRVVRNFDNNPFLYALQTSRAVRAYDDNGRLEFFRRNLNDFNILDELSKNTTGVNAMDMAFQTDVSYKILSNLTVSGRVSARYYHSLISRRINENSNEAVAYRIGTRPGDSEILLENNKLLYERPNETTGVKYSILPEKTGGIYNRTEDDMTNYYANANIDWSPQLGDNHRFAFMFGTEVRYVDRINHQERQYGYFFDHGGRAVANANFQEYCEMMGIEPIHEGKSSDRFVAFFLNGAYTWKEKYTLNGTVRYDGSNRLGRARSARWLPTWNISGKWAVKEESFLQSADWLSTLNLRLTYGLNATMGNTSNAAVVYYQEAFAKPLHPALQELKISLSALENRELTWEKQYELNVGLDLGLWDNRANLECNYYNRRGFDLIGTYKSNAVGGQLNKQGNIADMDSYGVELGLNATPVEVRGFRWNMNINYSYHHSKIKNLLSTAWAAQATSVFGVPVNGGPVRGIYSTRFAGLDHEGIPTFYDRNNEIVYNINTQTPDFADFVYSGNLEPTTTAGMQHTFSYKGISLSVLLSGQFGHKKRVMQEFSYVYEDWEGLNAYLKNRWRVAGDETRTDIPAILDKQRLLEGDAVDVRVAYDMYGMSDRWLADASFIRLKNVALNYSFPSKLVQQAGLTKVNIGLQATNLALLWLADRKLLGGEDPEFVWSGGTSMPISKQYTITLSVGF